MTGEIKAIEARIELAKKAKARTLANIKNIKAAFDAAVKEDKEASEDLKAAKDALKERVINIDEGDDDSDKKRHVSLSPHDEGKKKRKVIVYIWDAKVIEVSGCGFVEANGLYTRDDDFFVFRKRVKNDVVMEIAVWGVGHGITWKVSRDRTLHNECMSVIIYDSKSSSSDINDLNDGWVAEKSKYEPTPKLQVKEFI